MVKGKKARRIESQVKEEVPKKAARSLKKRKTKTTMLLLEKRKERLMRRAAKGREDSLQGETQPQKETMQQANPRRWVQRKRSPL